MANDKLGRPTKERIAVIRNQVSYLLWNGKLETTVAKAKAIARETEKLLTLAINTYEDNSKVVKTISENGTKVQKEVVNDGTKKLAARRKLMSFLYDLQEQRMPKESIDAFKARTEGINHPLVEKVFNIYAPKYAQRAKELGNAGGYTRVTKIGARGGDAAEMAIVELI